jgi:uncharacterized membrane protein YkoI
MRIERSAKFREAQTMKTIQTKPLLTAVAGGALALTAVLGAGVLPAQAGGAQHSKTAKISVAQAQAVALKKFPGKIVAKTTLENEEGKWQYSVMVKSGQTLREVVVGAHSGKIEDVEVTTSHKEGLEKD